MKNKKLHYAIISYHRPECVTINALMELGINVNDVIIFLQDENDLPKYNEKWSEIKKIFVNGKGVSANRNNVLKYDGYSVGDRVILLDDDVLSFIKMELFLKDKIIKAKSRKIKDKHVFINSMETSFEEAEKIGSCVFGVYPTGNAMFAKAMLLTDGDFSINRLFQGGLIGHIIDKKTYYDESYTSVEDYEFQLRIYSSGGITLRRNDLSVSKKANRNYAGGLFDFYRTGQQNTDLDRLCDQYKGFVKVKSDYSGVIQLHG